MRVREKKGLVKNLYLECCTYLTLSVCGHDEYRYIALAGNHEAKDACSLQDVVWERFNEREGKTTTEWQAI